MASIKSVLTNYFKQLHFNSMDPAVRNRWNEYLKLNDLNNSMKDWRNQLMHKDADIDTIILGCTHYPLLMPKILKYVNPNVRIVPQGEYVADSLKDYLHRHPDIEKACTKGGNCDYYTTENPDKFKESARIFLHEDVHVSHVDFE